MYQKVTLIGNLGRDPEQRFTPQGTAVTTFSVATSEKWTGQDGQPQEKTAWWRVSVFGKQAESCAEYLRKGSKVYVEGRMQADPKTGGPRIWEGKDGAPRASFEVTALTVKFLSSKSDGQREQAAGEAAGEEEYPF